MPVKQTPYNIFATDYDETLAMEGQVAPETLNALERLKDARWALILVTGRRLEELFTVFPPLALFDRVVAENGGMLYNPSTQEAQVLASPPPLRLIALLKERHVPFETGHGILASVRTYEKIISQSIHELNLKQHLIFNKESVMVLPSNINKATGLKTALDQMDLDKNKTVGVGDGENDHSFLQLCGLRVAVQNAVPNLKTQAHWVTPYPNGHGVRDLIDRLLTGKPFSPANIAASIK